jgi:DeoR family transcriptional regulator, deoxyribose operon repressor
MGKREDRLEEILLILKRKNASTVRDLSEELTVSEMTVRRDLRTLADEKRIQLIHGGAVYKPQTPTPEDLNKRTNVKYQIINEDVRNVDEKRRIGEKAATLIEPDDIVIIDSGSTTIHLTERIPEDLPFTAIFWALNILENLQKKKNCTMIFSGGYYHKNSMLFESPEGVSLINRNRANKGFFAAGGVSEKLGVTNSNPYAVDLKRASLNSSLTRILLVDSTKFGDIKPAHYAELEDFDIVITDTNIPDDYARIIENLGLVLYAV